MYVLPPNGIKLCGPDQALKLRCGLYGLKQEPRLWNEKWHSVMNLMKFGKLMSDDCVYRRGQVWLLLYVDYITLIGSTDENISSVKTEPKLHLDVKDMDVNDMGILRSFLGVLFLKDRRGVLAFSSTLLFEGT